MSRTIGEERRRFLERHGRSAREREACGAFVREKWPEEVKKRIRIADEVCRGEFLFDLPWDMERTVEPVAFEDGIDWMYMPAGDPEFIYQMNRHRFWVCLGQAYALTGKERYARAFVNQLMDWLDKNPINENTKAKTWRTIEAGIRGENWIKAMGYMAESPAVTDAVFERFMDGLFLHGEYLYNHEVPFSEKSNWGVLENSGLYALGLALGSGRGEAYAEKALARLERELKVQIMDDGVHWEQSPMYHNEVLRCALEVLRLAGRLGRPVPASFRDRVRAMAAADRLWQMPDFTQPAGGDSDRTDLRDVLSPCALAFQDGVLKSGGFETLDFESIWDWGMEGERAYEAIQSQSPEKTFYSLKDSGSWYLRSGWGRRDDYLRLCCGSLGGGHGHFDRLHLDLMAGGEDVLVDPGRFTYVDGPWRRGFKSAACHNGVTVDGREYTVCRDSWDVLGLAPSVAGQAVKKGIYSLIRCGHLGYMDQGLFVSRTLLAAGTRLFLIADSLYGTGEHVLTQHFHLAAGGQVLMDPAGFAFRGERCETRFIPLTKGAAQEKKEGWISSHYNQKEPAWEVQVSAPAAAPGPEGCQIRPLGTLVTAVICRDRKDRREAFAAPVPVTSPLNGRTLDGREAQAFLVGLGEERHLFVIAHCDIGSDCEYLEAMGRRGLGRVMAGAAGEKGPKEAGLTVLSW